MRLNVCKGSVDLLLGNDIQLVHSNWICRDTTPSFEKYVKTTTHKRNKLKIIISNSRKISDQDRALQQQTQNAILEMNKEISALKNNDYNP